MCVHGRMQQSIGLLSLVVLSLAEFLQRHNIEDFVG